MKKIFAALLTFALMLSVSSCGGNTDANSSEEGIRRPDVSVSSDAGESTVSPSVSTPSGTVSVTPAREDLAISATAFCDENANHVDGYEYAASCVNDEDPTTAWQKDGSLTTGNPEGSTWERDSVYGEGAEIYVGLEWAEAQSIDTVVIINDAGNVMETYENGGFTLEYLDGENWVEVAGLEEARENMGNMQVTLTFDAVSTTRIKLNMIKGISGGKNSPKLYTMSVYAAEETVESDASAESFDVSAEVSDIVEE